MRKRTLICSAVAASAFSAVCWLLVPSGVKAAVGGQQVQSTTAAEKQDSGKFVYADFENVRDKRPYSSRGGLVMLTAYSENPSLPSRFKGLADASPPTPESVVLKNSGTGRALAFEYELQPVNKWAGVGVEIQGQADQAGKPGSDDVSDFKFLALDLYVTGVSSIRAEFISRKQGLALSNGFPQIIFRVKEGLNTYRIELKKLQQPTWAEIKLNPKDVLRKLTAVNLVVFCDQCSGNKGTVVVDNLVFQKD